MAVGDPKVGAGAESGRGIVLMRALVDRVQFQSGDEAGTVVMLHKNLVYAEGSPASRLIAD
ncbi:MAG TPA: ATP-binding protein [Acidimicrobiales bacterium]|nr:ATP-binding protein [Acidimicrobiales bacterium]